MIRLGLLGRNISHSRSQEMYENLLKTKIEYSLFDFSSEEEVPDLAELFSGLDGLSITAPYKKLFIDHEESILKFKSFPAINCVHKPDGEGKFELYNTDYLAVLDILRGFEQEFGKNLEFIILGDGNMAQITSIALENLGHDFQIISRSKLKVDLNSLDYFDIFAKKADQRILINCCSRNFVFKAKVPETLVFWDHNYALKEHQEGLSGVCDYRDGLSLLRLQAREALKVWGLLS